MKVNMNVVQGRQKVGIFRSQDVAEIKLDIQFTEEEKYKIKKLGLMEYKFFEVPWLSSQDKARERFGNSFQIHIRDLVKGDMPLIRYDTLMEADQAMNQLEDQFRLLKQNLTEETPASRSLDL